MFAFIKAGGKQYRVTEGDVLKVESVDGEVGSSVEITDVLAVGEGDSINVGKPSVAGAKVVCEITGHGRTKKVLLFKKRRRKGYSKKQGHRQDFTSLKVKEIRAS